MEKTIEGIKRRITCDPKKDKKCKCKDYMELGHETGRPKYLKKRICERVVD